MQEWVSLKKGENMSEKGKHKKKAIENAKKYMATHPDNDELEETSLVSDIMADLIHYCKANGIDFEERYRVANKYVKDEELRDEKLQNKAPDQGG